MANSSPDLLVLTLRGVKLKNVEGTLATVGLGTQGGVIENRYLRALDNFMGKSDPFYEIRTSSSSNKVVATSNVVMDKHNPKWNPLTVDLGRLCGGDLDRPFVVAVYDWEESGDHQPMGSFDATVNGLLAARQQRRSRLERIDKSKAFQLKLDGADYGSVVVHDAEVRSASSGAAFEIDANGGGSRDLVVGEPGQEAAKTKKVEEEARVGGKEEAASSKAEENARIATEDEVVARRQAEEKERIAEKKAKVEAEEKAAREQAERDAAEKGVAEEKARIEAEIEAEERARKEAEEREQARREAAEKRIADERARLEAEAKLKVEEEAQLLAEKEAARLKAEEKERIAAEKEAARIKTRNDAKYAAEERDVKLKAEKKAVKKKRAPTRRSRVGTCQAKSRPQDGRSVFERLYRSDTQSISAGRINKEYYLKSSFEA